MSTNLISLPVGDLLDRLEGDDLPIGIFDLRQMLAMPSLSVNDVLEGIDYDRLTAAIEQFLEVSAKESAASEDTPSSEPEIVLHYRRGGQKPAPTQAEIVITARDRYQAKLIRDIQRELAKPTDVDFILRQMPDGARRKLYRPKVEMIIDGTTPVYVYRSLDPEDGFLALTLSEYEEYQPGGAKQYHHMEFVSEKHMRRGVELLKGYSFYTNKCSVGGEYFDPGLYGKWKVLVRNLMLPPGSRPSRFKKVLELKRTCYVHWLLDQMREYIAPLWAGITVELQGLTGEEFRSARIKRFAGLIDEIFDEVQRKARRGGERPASRDEIAEMLIAFIRELTGA